MSLSFAKSFLSIVVHRSAVKRKPSMVVSTVDGTYQAVTFVNRRDQKPGVRLESAWVKDFAPVSPSP
jgi:hypothetical protein